MYEKYFSFKCKPFDLLPNPEFLFQSSTHKKAITYLDYGIREKIGFILLTGEIGAGKTTIIRNLIKNLDVSIKLSRINNTKVSSEQLLSMINEDFGLTIKGKNKTTLLSELNGFLIEQYAKQSRPILLIDEAQNLSPDLLEEIRLLSNLETDRAKLLQIILVGQPELNKSLMLPEMMQLRQRINISYHISPLGMDETVQYIRHRLAVAGNTNVIQFEGEMPQVIYKFSRGIPRLINILCDLALLAVFVEGEKVVSTDILRDVISDLESRDNCTISPACSAGEPAVKDENTEYQSVAGDMALRIIKLEGSMGKILEEITCLSEKLGGLEKDVARINGNLSEHQLTAPVTPITGLEERTGEGQDAPSGGIEVKENEGLADHVETLKKMLSDVNDKLKKI